MFRLIFTVVFLLLFFIISIPIFFIEWIIGKINPNAKAISSLRIVQGAFKTILFLGGVNTTVIGYDNIPKDEPVLFIGNHRGIFDVVITYARMPYLTGFIAKKEIEKIPILRVWMRYLGCLFLDRDNLKEGLKTILTGIDMVKNDKYSIVIFPEGTRNKEDGVKPFKEGSFKIAEKSGCKIVPMAQNNVENVFENHFPFIKKTHTILEFGKPIVISELSQEERKRIGAYTQNVIAQMYENNKKLV